ncbi:MAG: carboxypeptidase regulatory-like domain-containing protein, partial [Verrucomicrobiota bacterium]
MLFASSSVARAQTTATGGVSGRVFNNATQGYVRNAEVRVEGTQIVTFTSDGGAYQLPGVAAGTVNIVVSYSGMQPTKASVTVTAGQVAVQDIELRDSFGTTTGSGDQALQLAKFEISEARSGQAKALQERRASINAKNVVASDNYGDLTMGDVGEFMKSMPGLSLDYVEVDTSAVRIGGLDPKYSTFTTDGARMATATSNNNAGRQNSFEQMSITGIESIE